LVGIDCRWVLLAGIDEELIVEVDIRKPLPVYQSLVALDIFLSNEFRFGEIGCPPQPYDLPLD
jgi:hypothetical protein